MTTTIAVNEKTRELLQIFGHKGETYDSILHRLMEIAKMYQFYEQQKTVLKNEKFYEVGSL
ncbi:hypothetical protein COS83_00110 [archaeon CG07_land_8_20_14_0_80_38_8]|nr:MAG: hypothetical protein COS83_00110 [archaeon CG07_land_8_20_14_0_80_38_8]